MSAAPPSHDAHLAALPEPLRATLEATRRAIAALLPGAVECISYRIPAFRLNGKVVAGYAAARRHCSLYPFSGSVLPVLGPALDGYAGTKSALHFALDTPRPDPALRAVVTARLAEMWLA